MAPLDDYEAHLSIGEVTVTYRDVEMLHAIDRCGSMHGAAESLERSYAHLQRRVVDLEDAIEPLTERVRGGSNGGGTRLLPAAYDLIRQYYRLQAKFDASDGVAESILPGIVVDRDGDVATVETAAGSITAIVPEGGTDVAVFVRADAVVLQRSEEPLDETTSLQNYLDGRVEGIEIDDPVARVTIGFEDDVDLVALTTSESVASLDLEPGGPVGASFDAATVRGVPLSE